MWQRKSVATIKKERFGWVKDPDGEAMVSEYACVAIGEAAEAGKGFRSSTPELGY